MVTWTPVRTPRAGQANDISLPSHPKHSFCILHSRHHRSFHSAFGLVIPLFARHRRRLCFSFTTIPQTRPQAHHIYAFISPSCHWQFFFLFLSFLFISSCSRRSYRKYPPCHSPSARPHGPGSGNGTTDQNKGPSPAPPPSGRGPPVGPSPAPSANEENKRYV